MSRLLAEAIDNAKDALVKAINGQIPISAQSILTLLLNVDGNGSGLDADYLRGMAPSQEDPSALNVIMSSLNDRFYAGERNLMFEPGTAQNGIVYLSDESGNPVRYGLFFDGNIVVLTNRSVNGVTEIRASGPSGGTQERAGINVTYEKNNLFGVSHMDGQFGGMIYWENNSIDGTYQTIMPYTNTYSFTVDGWMKQGGAFSKIDLYVQGTGGGSWDLATLSPDTLTLYFDQTNGMRIRRSAGSNVIGFTGTIKYLRV